MFTCLFSNDVSMTAKNGKPINSTSIKMLLKHENKNDCKKTQLGNEVEMNKCTSYIQCF